MKNDHVTKTEFEEFRKEIKQEIKDLRDELREFKLEIKEDLRSSIQGMIQTIEAQNKKLNENIEFTNRISGRVTRLETAD